MQQLIIAGRPATLVDGYFLLNISDNFASSGYPEQEPSQ